MRHALLATHLIRQHIVVVIHQRILSGGLVHHGVGILHVGMLLRCPDRALIEVHLSWRDESLARLRCLLDTRDAINTIDTIRLSYHVLKV